MKRALKIIFSLVLIVLFLIACMLIMTFGFVAAWLHTYRVFTFRAPIAEVSVSELKSDEKGEYAEVRVSVITTKSALDESLGRNVDDGTQVYDYKLYGDTIYLGSPIIKFKDQLILFNFQTIYKLGKVYARYDFDNQKELNRSPEIASSYDINNGYGDWKTIHDNFTSNTIQGFFYRLFVDTTQISSAGVPASNRPLTYTVYMTNTGILWELK